MLRYWNDPEKTAETIQNGWVHTGDIGVIDEEGFLSIVGRSKDMIIRGGENISPFEIESFFDKRKWVRDI
jgi:fatty-acyl-CoA synthase